MRVVLKPHPETPCSAITAFDCEVEREGGRLSLCWHLEGAATRIVLPEPRAAGRAEGLWRATCFEAFVKPFGGDAYTELNASPSGRWASYDFDDYRAGMIDAEAVTAGPIDLGGSDRRLILKTTFDGLASEAAWSVAISAVIELDDGDKSYWALAHAPGKPGFHHPDGFVLDLPADRS